MLAVRPGSAPEFAALAARHGCPAEVIGTVGGTSLDVAGYFDIPVGELAAAHRGTLPALFG